MVPYHRRGMEAERPASLLQPPADIQVVAGCSEAWIEAADRLETGLPKRHVAPGDVLRLAIGEQDVHRPAGRPCDAFGDPAVPGRSDVRPTHAGVRGPEKRGREVGEPVGAGIRVVVLVRDAF